MKIVIAPDSFKGSLGAAAAARAMQRGVLRALPRARCVQLPMADGGEGTAAVLRAAVGGRWVQATAMDPLGRPVRTRYALLEDGSAVIEMAAASGLTRLGRAERNPLRTTSYGTGLLVAHALQRGVRRIILGIGGSATNDAGAGLLQSLGVSLRGAGGRLLAAPASGGMLHRVTALDHSGLHRGLRGTRLLVACDVDNPLCGPRGASRVYAPQKGATPAVADRLDRNLRHFGQLLERDFACRVVSRPGAGAAGGTGAALLALGARIQPGAALVARAAGLAEQLGDAALVLTGEGRIDRQTPCGKVPAGVARVARRFRVPIIAIGGSLGEGAQLVYQQGIAGLESSVVRAMGPDELLQGAAGRLALATERALRLVHIGLRMRA